MWTQKDFLFCRSLGSFKVIFLHGVHVLTCPLKLNCAQNNKYSTWHHITKVNERLIYSVCIWHFCLPVSIPFWHVSLLQDVSLSLFASMVQYDSVSLPITWPCEVWKQITYDLRAEDGFSVSSAAIKKKKCHFVQSLQHFNKLWH